jgi:hypothetical protein
VQFGYRITGDRDHVRLFLSKRPEEAPSLRLFISSADFRVGLERLVRLVYTAQF